MHAKSARHSIIANGTIIIVSKLMLTARRLTTVWSPRCVEVWILHRVTCWLIIGPISQSPQSSTGELNVHVGGGMRRGLLARGGECCCCCGVYRGTVMSQNMELPRPICPSVRLSTSLLVRWSAVRTVSVLYHLTSGEISGSLGVPYITISILFCLLPEV